MSATIPNTRNPHFKLQCLSRLVNRHYDRYLAQSELKGSQFALLSQITALEPVRPSDLAARLQLDNSTLSRTVRTLHARGWVTFAPGNDARSRHIEMTESGRAQLANAHRHWRQAQRALCNQLDDRDLRRLDELLDRCTEALDLTMPD